MVVNKIKAYEIRDGRVYEGIPIQDDNMIHVGEEGRARQLVRVPLPPGAEIDAKLRRVTNVPLQLEEGGAVILIRDHSGFRGGWKLTAARTDDEWNLIVSRDSAHRPPDGQGALAQGHALEGQPCQTCDSMGIPPPRKPHEAHVIAEGYCAQGAAGRMGGGPEYLLVLRTGQAVEIVRSGRLYGRPSVLRVEVPENGVVKLTDPRAKAMERLAASRWQGLFR